MSAQYGIRAISFANGEDCPHAGQWLRHYNFDAYDGQGFGIFTEHAGIARTFPTKHAALEFWQRQSRVKPLRSDGEPNRPLTVLSVCIERIPK